MEYQFEKKDPATMQTAAGMPGIKSMNETLVFSESEKEKLRELATRVAEIAVFILNPKIKNLSGFLNKLRFKNKTFSKIL